MTRAASTAAARILLVIAVATITYLATTPVDYAVAGLLPDKANHLLAFGALSLLADYSFPSGRFGAAKVAALLGYGVLIEVVQYFIPNRDAELLDLVADSTGIALYAASIVLAARVPLLRPLEGLRRPP